MIDRRTVLFGTLASGGCGIVPKLPDLGRVYEYASQANDPYRRPIVTIPGLLGSRLRVGKDGDFAWGGPRRLSLNPTDPDAARRLALPFGDGTEHLRDLKDELRTSGVFRVANADILGSTIQQQIYDGMVKSLNKGGYEFSQTDEEERARSGNNPGSLEFPFDWRRDIVEAARELDDFVERKAVQVERVRMAQFGESIPAEKMRFDFVAHSLGTLVLRYWLMYGTQDLPEDGSLPEVTWAGAKRAACAIFVAPPNLGSISALQRVVGGHSLGPFQPVYPPALLASHHSIYQLMPRSRHERVRVGGLGGPSAGDLYDVETWARNRWALFDPEQDGVFSILAPGTKSAAQRRSLAERHMHRVLNRAEQLHRALDIGGAPRGPDMFLVAGTGLETAATATVGPNGGALEVPGQEEGDGVVLRASALLDERQGSVTKRGKRRPIGYRTTLLLPGEHLEITHNPVFADNLLHWLLGSPRQNG